MSLKRPYEDDVSDELEAQIKKAKTEVETIKKHSLDSDEEDSDENEKSRYEILADDDIEGQEEGVAGQDGEVKLTPFNMKEEMEEGHFDVEGNYHWNKEELVKDHWLDNIDWVKLKDGKEDNTKSDEGNYDAGPPSPFDQNAIYKQMLELMEPGENVSQSIKRLGGARSLSASERLKRRKAGLSLDCSGSSEKVTLLTELANKILTKTGNMDIYQEKYAYIRNKTEQSSSKGGDELDMYADDFDEKEKVRKMDNVDCADNEPEKAPMWEYKISQTDEEIKGPYTSEQMQSTAENLKEEFWVRKIGCDGPFYSSKRIDFDLYS